MLTLNCRNRQGRQPDHGAADASAPNPPLCPGPTEPARTPANPARENGASPLGFRSVLFPGPDTGNGETATEAPDFFRDLNLDQIVDSITAGRQEYNLKPFFYTRLTDLDAVAYRQEIMRDLESKLVSESIQSFSRQMRTMRQHLSAAENWRYRYAKERWFLDAARIYGEAVAELCQNLGRSDPRSRGLCGFRDYLARYTEADCFGGRRREAEELVSALSAIRYTLLIKDGSVTVRDYASEMDYSAVVEATFARFKQGAAKDYLVKFSPYSGMSHVEAAVLDLVARLNPDVFARLDAFCAENGDFLDKTIADFDREIQFYVAYLEYQGVFERAGLTFCYPQVSDACKSVSNRRGFDLALAGKLLRENAKVVGNDFALNGSERVLVVTGPNQGGKTTFARTFGQLHYLASLGLPVPGAEARLFLCDRLFAHFEREEDIATLRGKLQDDLVRIRRIFDEATPNSIVVINEMLSSTSVKDGLYLSRKVMERICRLDLLCVCVTFLDELSALNEKTVSVVAAVAPEDPTLRTFKIERRPADGLAYALALADKHRLTYARLKERLES